MTTTEKRCYCFFCGEDIGPKDAFSDPYDTCGKIECEREARYSQHADRAEREDRAAQDDYELYR